MAGSYRHIIKNDGSFDQNISLIENLRDAQGAIEEMYDMIQHLTGGDKHKIHEAWREGHMRLRCPFNADDESICSFDAYWEPFGVDEN